LRAKSGRDAPRQGCLIIGREKRHETTTAPFRGDWIIGEEYAKALLSQSAACATVSGGRTAPAFPDRLDREHQAIGYLLVNARTASKNIRADGGRIARSRWARVRMASVADSRASRRPTRSSSEHRYLGGRRNGLFSGIAAGGFEFSQ